MTAGTEPYGGGLPVVADTSAWMRAAHASVAGRWVATAQAGALALSTSVVLEVLYTAQSTAMLGRLDRSLALFRQPPITRAVGDAALSAMRELGDRIDDHPGAHRISPIDYLTAAVAAEQGFGVLHYDRDFDRLAEVLPFESVWVAPPGSLD